jgi:hypothetical protein
MAATPSSLCRVRASTTANTDRLAARCSASESAVRDARRRDYRTQDRPLAGSAFGARSHRCESLSWRRPWPTRVAAPARRSRRSERVWGSQLIRRRGAHQGSMDRRFGRVGVYAGQRRVLVPGGLWRPAGYSECSRSRALRYGISTARVVSAGYGSAAPDSPEVPVDAPA